jgi:hypothetical protein
LLVVSSLAFWPPFVRGQEAEHSTVHSNFIEQFDIFTDGDLLLVPVRLDQQVFKFAVDTGSGGTIYDRSLRAHLGPMRGATAAVTPNGMQTIELFDSPEASLGKLSLRTSAQVTCMDLGNLRQATGHDVFGFVGMDFLKKHVINLDFDRGKLSILKTVGLASGTPIPISFQRDLPFVPVSNPRAEILSFLVDTGAGGALGGGIGRGDFKWLVDHGSASVRGSAFTHDLLHTNQNIFIILHNFSIGNHVNRQINATVNNGQFPSYLALAFLKRYNVTFDFPNRVMYLSEGRQFSKPIDSNRSGLHPQRQGGRIIIHSVDPGLAEQAGIRPGDLLLKVDGTDAARLRFHSLQLKVCALSSPVRLTVERGKKAFEVQLEPLNQ